MAGKALIPTFFSLEENCDACGQLCTQSTQPPEFVMIRRPGGRNQGGMLCARCYKEWQADERRIKQEEAAAAEAAQRKAAAERENPPQAQ